MASLNLVSTYFSLGMKVPGSYRFDGLGYQGVRSDENHPICNFAFLSNIQEETLQELIEDLVDHSGFHLLGPQIDDELLQQFALCRGTSLVIMEADGASRFPIAETAITAQARKQAADFMGREFFPHSNLAFRERFALAVANATENPITLLNLGGELIGTAMLHQTEERLGIYNLCVKREFRGQGFGRDLISRCLATAYSLGLRAELQCERSLVDWYRCQGFAEVNSIHSFFTTNGYERDIMRVLAVQ